MAVIEINRNPTPKDLKWFGLVLALFLGVVGAMARWRFDAPTVSLWLWALGAGLALVYYAVPPLRRWMFVGWMILAFPLGWVISHLLLGITYYLVITPIGLLMRLLGRDPMHRRPDPTLPTYWRTREPSRDPDRYFRQF